MAKEPKTTDPAKMSRRAQFVETYRMARKTDRRLGLWVAGSFLVGAIVGFAGVMSGPLVRSSYRAGRLYQQAVAARDAEVEQPA